MTVPIQLTLFSPRRTGTRLNVFHLGALSITVLLLTELGLAMLRAFVSKVRVLRIVAPRFMALNFSVLCLAVVITLVIPHAAGAGEVYRFSPPWGGVWERGDEVFVGLGTGGSVSFKDVGIVTVFEMSYSFGGGNVQKYNQFRIDPRDIGGAGIYHIEARMRIVASNFTVGSYGVGAHGGWVHMFVDYDMVKREHKDKEVLNPFENVLIDAVTMALELWGATGANEMATYAQAVWSGVSGWDSPADIIADVGEAALFPDKIETDITVRNPEMFIDIALGAEVNGSGVGANILTGGLVGVLFDQVTIEKIADIEPIAEMEILSPADRDSIYRDDVDTLPLTIRIRDDDGKTNTVHPYIRLSWEGGSREYDEEVSIDVPAGEWVTQTVYYVDLNALDPGKQAKAGWVYIPAYHLKGDWGYYTCTDRNDFNFKVHGPPVTPYITEAPSESYPETQVRFKAVSIDPDDDLICYRFSWGDGDTSEWTAPAPGSLPVEMYHGYDSTGTYYVTSQAKDTCDKLSEWSDSSVISILSPPGIGLTADLVPGEMFWGGTCRLTVCATDSAGDSSRFYIDWGDSSLPGWTVLYTDGQTVDFNHAYDETVGTAHVSVKAADEYGDTSAVVARSVIVMPLRPAIDSTEAYAHSVYLQWNTEERQKVLGSCRVFYSADPSPNDSVEVPVPVHPYEPACTVLGLAPDTRYYFWVEESYVSEDTITATSFVVDAYTAPSPPTVEYLAPAGGTLSGTVTVKWLATDPDIEDTPLLDIDIDRSIDGGPWINIGADFNGVNDGSYLWNTQDINDGAYVLRIVAEDPFDNADTAFSETLFVDNPDAPVVTVRAPQTDYRWSGVHDITWGAYDADGDELTISISFSSDHGKSWGSLASGEPNDSVYSWNTAFHPDGGDFIIKVVAEDPGGLKGEHVSGIFTVDNTPPLDFWFYSFVPVYDSVNVETVELGWPRAVEPLSDPVRYYIYWGSSAATIDYQNPVLVTKATTCSLTALPPGPSFFAIAAEDSVDEPNYALNTDIHCVYFTQTGGPADNTLAGVVSQSNGVVTGTAPNYQFNGSVVVIPSDFLLITNENCTFNDTTGNACIKTYEILKARGSTFAAQAPGDWRGIIFEDRSMDYGGGIGCEIDSCVIRHAVNGASCYTADPLIDMSWIYENEHAGIDCYESNVVITRNKIHSNQYGVYCDREGPTAPFYADISSNHIHDNTVSGTHFAGGAMPFVTGNRIYDNTNGCSWTTGATPTAFDHNDIFLNSDYGMINYDQVFVTAEYNWWGDGSGPSGAAMGKGDAVNTSKYIDYLPFLTSAVNAPTVDWANLEGPPNMAVPPGMLLDMIYGRVFEDGVTEELGQGGGIGVEFGYGPDGSYPWSAGWVWTMAWYSGDQGDYDEYVCETDIFAPGTFDYCFRYTMDGGDSYIYGDLDGNDTGDGGSNGYSIAQAGDLSVGDGPTILLVDDDEGSTLGDVFNDALNANGLSFDLWDVDSSGTPTLADLMEHNIVIWNTGAASSQTLTSNDESDLAYYLNYGGRLFLSSQDYLSDIGVPNDFSTTYLHLTDWSDGANTEEVEGVEDDPITDGMVYALSYPFPNASENLEVDSLACAIFMDVASLEPAALRYPSDGPGYYKVVFLAFPFEAVSPASERTTLMGNIIDWLSVPCIPALFDPMDSSWTDDNSPDFTWARTAGVGGRYMLEYSTDSDFTAGVTTVENITDSAYTVPTDSALIETTYYWHVKAIDARGNEGEYQSQPFMFEEDYIPGVPQLLSPGHTAETNDPTPGLVWNYVDRSYGTYTLQYALDSVFTSGLVTVTGLIETTYTVTDTLPDSTYYWHVEAISHQGYESGYQASPFEFTVDTHLPPVPVLIGPADLAGSSDPTPDLVWSGGADNSGQSYLGAETGNAGWGGGASGCTYTLQYALDSTFTTGVVTVADLTDTAYTIPDSLPDGDYYWHVEFIDMAGNQSGYQVHPYNLVIDTEPPSIPLLFVPADSSTITECKPTFIWNSTAGIRGAYTLEYAFDDGFTQGICTAHCIFDTAFTISYPYQPLSDTSYFWHVEAADIAANMSGYQAYPFMFSVGAAGVHGPERDRPAVFSLAQNYPNPFRAGTTIRYSLAGDSHVKISVYNVLGQNVVTLVDEHQAAGMKTIRWDGGRAASGIYFCHMRAGTFVDTKKMLLLK